MSIDLPEPPVRLDYDSLRELGAQPITLTFEGEVTLDRPNGFTTPAVRRQALHEVERQLHDFASRIAQQIVRSREDWQQRVRTPSTRKPMLPWLALPTEEEQQLTLTVSGQYIDAFEVETSLYGQGFYGEVTLATLPVGDDQFVTITVTQIELIEGSLKSKIRGTIMITIASLTLIITAASPIIQDEYDDWRFETRLVVMVEGEECQGRARFTVDLHQLRALGIDALNVEEPGITEEERAIRVCNVQLALNVAQNSPALIDGKPGPQTRAALAAFAERHDLPADLSNETLRGLLLQHLQQLE